MGIVMLTEIHAFPHRLAVPVALSPVFLPSLCIKEARKPGIGRRSVDRMPLFPTSPGSASRIDSCLPAFLI